MKNYFKQIIINEKYEKAWSKIADSTPSGKFDRIWEFSCKPLEFFPKKFKDPTDLTESTKNKNDSNDEFTEEDLENEESEHDSDADSEDNQPLSSDFEYESETDNESDIDPDCEKF